MKEPVIDIHIHFGAPGDEESGCYWSKKFRSMPAYYVMLFITHSLGRKITVERVKKHLFAQVDGAKNIQRAVFLALDQVYDENGNAHPEWTHLHASNRCIVKLARENPRVLLGASVHPYRKDWQEELDYCLKNRAVLCKWIPSSQMIDPTHAKCRPFYKKLAITGLPLLYHAGPEYTIPTQNDGYNEFNNPKYLRKALNMGVTAIIAHCALPYFSFLDRNYLDDMEDFFKLFKEAEQNGWQLYADLSAVATPLRAPYIQRILDNIPQERILLGSDYPIPASELSYTHSKNIFKWLKLFWQAVHIRNPLDKNYRIIQNMGFEERIFSNAVTLFENIRYS